ncbi:MAG TPA: flavodoxin domain-containing protein [Methylophilaceae bacterium]|nr:flavodoxin domain-containing protein [Methylophilaceae bacterium]
MTANTAERLIEDTQLSKLDLLLKEFNSDQLLWLSGYIAALGKHAVSGAGNSSAPKAEASKVLVAYGTETGNSQALASKLAFALEQKHIAFELKNLSQMRARHLSRYHFILIICSTHGDGDPPEPMSNFYTSVMAADAPRMSGVHYAVLALGDSSYPKFCATGQALDDRLSALGAGRLLFRQDCDTDFSDLAGQWITDVSGILAAKLPKAEASTQARTDGKRPADSQAAEHNRNHPLKAEVIENIRLSHADRSDAIHHIELGIDVSLPELATGDALGILVENAPRRARELIELAGCAEDAVVRVNHRNIPLLQALIEECDITVPSKRLIVEWAKHSKSPFLRDLLVQDPQVLREFLKTHQVCDIAAGFPTVIDAQSLVDGLKPLQPRLYDLANSPQQNPEELHILVKRYQYAFNDRLCSGVGSEYLADLNAGDAVRVFPYRNAKFHFPQAEDTPVIFIAEGTGIGPFRAYLQDIAERAHGPAWLIFAERSFEEDFLYQAEWQQAVADGHLALVDGIFHDRCDDACTIEALLHARQATLFEYLGQGAHVYLCGDRALLQGVEASLEALVSESAHPWPALQEAARIHRNLY